VSASGFKINRQGIAQMAREIELEFAKHPVKLPVVIDNDTSAPAWAGSTTIYNGPVVNMTGNQAQLALGNRDVTQTQAQPETIAPGFEQIAIAIAETLKNLGTIGLSAEDQADAEVAAREVLEEVTKTEPDRGLVRRGVTMIKGLLTPIALGLQAGAAVGATEWAHTAIEQLGAAVF